MIAHLPPNQSNWPLLSDVVFRYPSTYFLTLARVRVRASLVAKTGEKSGRLARVRVRASPFVKPTGGVLLSHALEVGQAGFQIGFITHVCKGIVLNDTLGGGMFGLARGVGLIGIPSLEI